MGWDGQEPTSRSRNKERNYILTFLFIFSDWNATTILDSSTTVAPFPPVLLRRTPVYPILTYLNHIVSRTLSILEPAGREKMRRERYCPRADESPRECAADSMRQSSTPSRSHGPVPAGSLVILITVRGEEGGRRRYFCCRWAGGEEE